MHGSEGGESGSTGLPYPYRPAKAWTGLLLDPRSGAVAPLAKAWPDLLPDPRSGAVATLAKAWSDLLLDPRSGAVATLAKAWPDLCSIYGLTP